MGKSVLKAKRCCRAMPFQKDTKRKASSVKDTQRANVMAGLRAIGAPLVGKTIQTIESR